VEVQGKVQRAALRLDGPKWAIWMTGNSLNGGPVPHSIAPQEVPVADPEQAVKSQLANIEKRSGRSLAELIAALAPLREAKHGEKVAFLKQTFALGHGDANTLVHHAKKQDVPASSDNAQADVLDDLYTGGKAALRPIHELLLRAIAGFGNSEAAPKKGYVSYRRRRQFAMIGPATQTRVELGLNIASLPEHERLLSQPPGRMCTYVVRLTRAEEVDAPLLAWLRAAYDAAG